MFLNFLLIYALLWRNFIVAIYALFPQIFWDWKGLSADFYIFRMYGRLRLGSAPGKVTKCVKIAETQFCGNNGERGRACPRRRGKGEPRLPSPTCSTNSYPGQGLQVCVINHLLWISHWKNKFTNHELILVPTQTNLRGREWTIGKPLGQGGFGAIYLIEPGRHKKVDDGAEYVVKVSKFFPCSWKLLSPHLMLPITSLWMTHCPSGSLFQEFWILLSI